MKGILGPKELTRILKNLSIKFPIEIKCTFLIISSNPCIYICQHVEWFFQNFPYYFLKEIFFKGNWNPIFGKYVLTQLHLISVDNLFCLEIKLSFERQKYNWVISKFLPVHQLCKVSDFRSCPVLSGPWRSSPEKNQLATRPFARHVLRSCELKS